MHQCSHYYCWEGWIKEDRNAALDIMQKALSFKCHHQHMNEYIKFIDLVQP
jgi:hypothetical protein